MALCHRCKRFDLHTILHASSESWPGISGRESDYYWHEQAEVFCFRHYDNILKVRYSASAGCKLCGIISAAFERKGAEADEIAGNLPIVLREGWGSKIKASFISPEEGLITLCDLDVSISNHELSFTLPALLASQACTFRSQTMTISGARHSCRPSIQSLPSNPS